MVDFSQIASKMLEHNMKLPDKRIHVSIPDSKELILEGLKYFTGSRNVEWIDEYDHVVAWLGDNKYRGLFMFGDCGRGKSLLSRYIIPAIFLEYMRKVVSVYEMSEINTKLDEALTKKIISLDDVGVEDVAVRYGERRMAFAELMDSIEKNEKLAIITTNLSVNELQQKYGDRVLDRIISTTKRVEFKGKSLRK